MPASESYSPNRFVKRSKDPLMLFFKKRLGTCDKVITVEYNKVTTDSHISYHYKAPMILCFAIHKASFTVENSMSGKRL